MKKRILNNFGYKILAVVLAILLWLTIINVIDPATPKQISGISVELLNKESLTDLGYTFEVLEGNTVSITVTGPVSVVDKLTSADFYACADLSTISPLSDYVEIQVKCTKSSISTHNLNIVLRNDAVKLNIENRESRTMDVEVELTGTPASGFAAGDYDLSPMSIKITGAESTVESIARVVAQYDIEGVSMDISDNVKLRLYDEDGTEISTKGLILSKEEVRLKVPILVKKVVPVNYAYTGTVKEGYKVSKITHSIENVVIAGTAATIEGIQSIDLPAELINISDINADTSYSVRISHYVPSNVKILSEVVSEVVVDVEPLITKVFEIPTDKFELLNADEKLNYEFTKKSVSVTYSGLKEDIEAMAISGIVAKADVSGLTAGTRTVKVQFENTNNCTVVGEYTVPVVVSK